MGQGPTSRMYCRFVFPRANRMPLMLVQLHQLMAEQIDDRPGVVSLLPAAAGFGQKIGRQDVQRNRQRIDAVGAVDRLGLLIFLLVSSFRIKNRINKYTRPASNAMSTAMPSIAASYSELASAN